MTAPRPCATPPGATSDSTQETWSIAIDYIVGRKRAEETLGFLAASSRELAATLDYESSFPMVARYVVAWFADWCRFDLFDDTGGTQLVASAQAPEVSPSQVQGFVTFSNPADPAAHRGVAYVGRHRAPVLYSEREAARQVDRDDPVKLMLSCGVRSAMLLPLMARDRILGVLSIASGTQKQRVYGAADLALAIELAQRAASAVEIARLHQQLRELRSVPR